MDGSYISMAMRVHWLGRDGYVIAAHVGSLFESSHSCDGLLGRLRIATGPVRDDQARNKDVREFTFLRKAIPAGLAGPPGITFPLRYLVSWRPTCWPKTTGTVPVPGCRRHPSWRPG